MTSSEQDATRDPSESLTLDTEALSRAQLALMATNADEGLEHDCSDWTDDDDDGCSDCWEIAARVVRAAEGLCCCARCKGTGDIGSGAAVCCSECGGNGLQAREAAPIHTTETEDR